jgi:hypothetical protein
MTWVYQLLDLPREEVAAAAAVLLPEVEAEEAAEGEEERHHSEAVEAAAAAAVVVVVVVVRSQNHSVGEVVAVQTEVLFFQAEAVQVQLDGPRGVAAAAAARVEQLTLGVKVVRVVALEAVGALTYGKADEVHAEVIERRARARLRQEGEHAKVVHHGTAADVEREAAWTSMKLSPDVLAEALAVVVSSSLVLRWL